MRENEAQILDQGVYFLQTVVGPYDREDWISATFCVGVGQNFTSGHVMILMLSGK